MCTRSVRTTLVFDTTYTVCSTQKVYYIYLLCVKYGMHAYAGPTCTCGMHAPSMLIPPTQNTSSSLAASRASARTERPAKIWRHACARSTDRDQGARARTRKIFPPSFRGRGRRRASVALFAHTTHDARRRRRRGARAACETTTTTTTTTTVRACDADVRGAGAIPRIDDGSRWMIN